MRTKTDDEGTFNDDSSVLNEDSAIYLSSNSILGEIQGDLNAALVDERPLDDNEYPLEWSERHNAEFDELMDRYYDETRDDSAIDGDV